MYMDAQRSLLLYDDLTLYLWYGVLTNDTKDAYLHTSNREDEPQIYMYVDKMVSKILCEVSPAYR